MIETSPPERPSTRVGRALMLVGCALVLIQCTSHRVKLEPIEFKPIHLTLDINLKVQRELDNFFDFEEQGADELDLPTSDADNGN